MILKPKEHTYALYQDIMPKCREAVIKIASRCNLNCSYCYMYNMGDTTYLKQPAVMTQEVIEALIGRVADHCLRHGIRRFSFTFHGGEPLLAGPELFRFFVARVRALLPREVQPVFFVQTNGTLLTPQWCALLRELQVKVGISLDGPQQVNDMQRVDHIGRGSYERVRAGWNNAMEEQLQPGILTVVNLASDPEEIYFHLKQMSPRKIDFLLPQATYDTPPAGVSLNDEDTPYADWLIKVFHLWNAEDTPPFQIRLFDQILGAVLGMPGRLDALGMGDNELLMIETNGAIETVDVLRVCRNGITRNHYNVKSHSFDAALEDELIQLYYFSNRRLCATCRNCAVNEICGAGYLPHRYSSHNGFDNPSVYCRDLMKLITELRNHALSLLPEEVLIQAQLNKLSYSEARQQIAV